MTGHTPFGLDGSMFISERSLLVCVALNTRGIGASREPCLLQLKTAVRIVAIAALHRPFENLMMERRIELVLRFAMATQAKLRLAHLQHSDRRETGLLGIRLGDQGVRTGHIPSRIATVWRMAFRAADVVTPVFAAAEIVVLLSSRVAGQTGFGGFLGRFILERNDLGRIAFGQVSFARTMTRFTARDLSFPTRQRGQLEVRSMREVLELIFVTFLASLAAHIVFVRRLGAPGRIGFLGALRRVGI